MSFWTQQSLEPKRNFRFKIISDGWDDNESVWWWAKSIDKPSFNITNNEYQLINHKFKYPGIVTWNSIQITLADIAVDGPNANDSLEGELFKLGYSRPGEGAMKGLEKFSSRGPTAVSSLQIQHLDANGNAVDTWTLKGAFITSVSYSKLDYSSDEITEVTLEIVYDYADYE